MKIHTLLDFGTLATILLTFVLFVAALAVKGFTHDVLLEAGVFLVSVKLVLTSYKSGIAMDGIRAELVTIRTAVEAGSVKSTESFLQAIPQTARSSAANTPSR